jgi:hypothetical protein
VIKYSVLFVYVKLNFIVCFRTDTCCVVSLLCVGESVSKAYADCRQQARQLAIARNALLQEATQAYLK